MNAYNNKKMTKTDFTRDNKTKHLHKFQKCISTTVSYLRLIIQHTATIKMLGLFLSLLSLKDS